MRTPAIASALLFIVSGCSVGGVMGGDDDDDAVGDDDSAGDDDDSGDDDEQLIERYTLAASPADQTIRLAEAAEYQLTLSSENFDGPVTLAAAGVPSTWTVTFEPSDTIELVANQDTVVTMRVGLPSSGEAVAATLDVTANGAMGEVAAQTSMTVLPELIVPIVAGTGSGQHGFQNLAVHAGVTVKFANDDSVGHRIHAGGVIDHQGSTMGPGQSYDIVMIEQGEADFYCHDHGDGSGAATLVVLP
jgi:plastocyanin